MAQRFKPGIFVDVSCSSAETKHMTEPQTGLPAGGPPQFNALRNTANVVTVGIGGNDAGLVGVAEECAQLGATNPTGMSCRNHYAPGGHDTVAAKIEATKPKIAAVLEGIHAMIAGQAAAHDAEFVDTYRDSGGHDVCKLPPTRWFEGLVPTEPAYPLHPNGKGEASMARSTIAQLSRPRPTPRLARLRVSPRRVRLRRKATIRFRLSKPALVTLKVRRAKPGRRHGGHCAAPTRRNRGHLYCRRYSRVVVRIRVFGKAGANKLRRRSTRKLGGRTGVYRIRATPSIHGATGRASVVRYRITPRRRHRR